MRSERSVSAPSAGMQTCEAYVQECWEEQLGRLAIVDPLRQMSHLHEGESRELEIVMKTASPELQRCGQWLLLQACQTDRSQMIPEKLPSCSGLWG